MAASQTAFGAMALRPTRIRVVLLACALIMASANADEVYPNRSVRLIVPTTPGAGSDVTARTAGDEMAKKLGQPFVVENRSGAGGMIAGELVAKSAPNGYTLFAGTSSVMIMLPAVSKRKLPFDPDIDLIPIGRITHSAGFVLVVAEKSPYRTLNDLIAAAKANPGKITYGSAGPATNPHMLGELLSILAGVTLNHIAYKGPGPAQIDLLAGGIDCQFDTPSSVAPHIVGGRLRGLALTDRTRYRGLPAVPTTAETGFPDLYLRGWTAMYAPRNTPAAIVSKLQATLKEVLEMPQFNAKMQALDQQPGFLTGDELLREQRSDRERWRKVAAARNIVLE